MPDRIERLSLLAQALGANPDWPDLSRLLVLRLFDSWGCTTALFYLPAVDGSLVLDASFGCPEEGLAALKTLPRSAGSPVHAAVHSDEIVWLPDPVDVAESVGGTPLALAGTESIVVLPITRLGIPERVLVLLFDVPLPANPASGPFISAVKSLLELHGGGEWSPKAGPAAPTQARPTSAEAVELSARQLRILGLLARGKTNRWIAAELGFSESTIRQETLRLYRALGVNSRSDAVKVAQGLGIIAAE